MAPRPTISDYMAKSVLTLPPDMEIIKAMTVLLEKRFSGAPVVNATGELVGMLSKKDCIRAALHACYHEKPGGIVADHMSRDVRTLDADTDLVKAAEAFTNNPFRRFPVLREGRLA